MRWLAVAFLVGGIGLAVSGFNMTGGTPSGVDRSLPSGEVLFVAKGCSACHAMDGVSDRNVGPNLSGLAASPESIRRSIVDPAAELADGFTWPMPDLGLRDEEVDALVAYLTAGS